MGDLIRITTESDMPREKGSKNSKLTMTHFGVWKTQFVIVDGACNH